MPEPEEPRCPKCFGVGWITVGDRVKKCDCRQQQRTQTLLRAANIPARYADCTFDDFFTFGPRAALREPLAVLKKFADEYPIESRGLLVNGDIGTGKTHLACAVLHHLIVEKGIACQFFDYAEMLKRIGNSYRPGSEEAELELLSPLIDTPVILIDDLASMRCYDWMKDIVGMVLNQRYNAGHTTILTCNYDAIEIGDRMGPRLQSRLTQMCLQVPMFGPDFRMEVGAARWRGAA